MAAAKVWDLFDIIILLAWLDFCIERKTDFEQDVVRLLRESRKQRTGQEYPFTMKQVVDKLTDLARNDSGSRIKGYPRLKEIHTRGSACFPRQAKEIRLEINLALKQFRETHHDSNPQEARRSNREENVSNATDAPSEGNSKLPDRYIGEVSSMPRRVSSTITPNTTRNAMKRGYPHDKSLSSHAPLYKTVKTSSKKIEVSDGYSPGKGAWKRSQILEHRHDAVGRTERLWEEDVASLRGQIADLGKEKQRLQAMLQDFENAQQQSQSAGHDPKEDRFRVYQQDLWNSHQLNMELENVAKFFKLDPIENRALEVEDINKSMDQIQAELESILGNYDTANLQVNRALEHGSDIQALLLSCLKLHANPERLDSRLTECISQFEIPILVRAVVLAAINEWVFNISFPPFMSEGSTSLFLKSIEEIALEHRDWAWLRNFESAAYSRFCKRSEFKEGLLPMKSRLLADRLSNATSELITPIASEASSDNMPQAIDSILESLNARYIKLFSAALEFKAAAAATDNRYEFVLKLPGTLTPENSQDQGAGKTFTMQERSRETDIRRSWFHASLRVYDAGPANWLNPRMNAIIQTDNFIPNISEADCRCIYQKDIVIERSHIKDNSLSLQPHRSIGRSGRESLGAQSASQSNGLGTRLKSSNETNNALENTHGEQSQAAYSSANELATPEPQHENDSGSESDFMSAVDPYEAESGTSRTQAETTTANRVVLDSRNVMRTAPDAHVCGTCGASLSNHDSRRRHERNRSCRRCKICALSFPTKEALKKHQLSDHQLKTKRQRLSQDGSYANKEKAEPNSSGVCGRCNREFTQFNLERHLKNKSCSKCFKCGAEFDTAHEFYTHMNLSHNLQFIQGHWKRPKAETRAKQSSALVDVPRFDSSEETGHLPTQHTAINQAPVAPQTRSISSFNAHIEHEKESVEIMPDESSIQTMEPDLHASPVSSKGEKIHSSTCNDNFVSQYSLEKHKGGQRHRLRIREIQNASAIEQPISWLNHSQPHAAKGKPQDKILKGRIEKQPRANTSTERRREPTPESRHITRIIASLAKISELVSGSATSSAKADKQPTAITDKYNSQDSEKPHAVSKTIENEGKEKMGEKAQVLKAPANFGGQFSAPPRTFENVAAGSSSLATQPL